MRIFISYSSKDRAIAEELHEVLEASGFEVWRDKTRLETDWSREIAMALAESDGLCLLWTANSAKSEWVKHEWLTARALGKAIIPCLWTGAPDLPKPLVNIEAVEFSERAGFAIALKKRLDSVKGTSARYDYSVLPPNSYIPFNPNPNFTGRLPDLVDLYLNMIGNLHKIGINQVGCVGMGGTGKTQLVVEFAYRFSFAFEGIFWIQAVDQEHWLQEFARIARDYLRLSISESTGFSEEDYIFALHKFFREHPRYLIIMDNVVEPRMLNSDHAFSVQTNLTPLALGNDLLFTTRTHFQLPGVITQRVEPLPSEDAYRLLTQRRAPETLMEAESARRICNSVGYLPLALVLVAGYLNQYHSVSFGDYYEELTTNKLDTIDIGEMSAEELATRHDAAITVTLNAQWEALKSENAKHLFAIISLFPETSIIPLARLVLLSGLGPGRSKIDRPAEKAFHQLADLNLVEFLVNENSARLHPLVHAFSSHFIDDAKQVTLKTAASKSLSACYQDSSILYREYEARGVDSVIGDLDVGVLWCPAESSNFTSLKRLRKVLDRERHHLQADLSSHEADSQPTSQSHSFFQQLHYRAKIMGLDDLGETFSQAADAEGPMTFHVIGATTLGDKAIRQLKLPNDPDFMEDAARIVVMTSDGRRALSAGWRKLTYWDVERGRPIRRLEGHSDYIKALTFCDDENYAVSADNENTFIIWNLESTSVQKIIPDHPRIDALNLDRKLQAVNLGATGRYAVAVYSNREQLPWDAPRDQQKSLIVLFEVKSSRVVSDLEYSAWMNAICLDENNHRVIFGDLDRGLTVWDTTTGETVEINGSYTCKDYKYNGISEIAISPDGRRVLTAINQCLVLWDLDAQKVVRDFLGHTHLISAVSFSRDGLRVLSASSDRTLMLWDLETGKPLQIFKGHSGGVDSATFSTDGRRILSGSTDGSIILWDAGDLQEHPGSEGHADRIVSASLSKNGRYGLTSDSQSLIWWDAETGEVLLKIDMSSEETFNVIAIDKRGQFTDTQNPKAVHLMGGPIFDADLSPDGNRAALALGNGDVLIGDLPTATIVVALEGHRGPVTSVCFGSDNEHVLSGSYDRRVILWRISDQRIVRTLRGHKNAITVVCLSVEGQTAASGTETGTVIYWNVDTGKEIGRIEHGTDEEKRHRFFDINRSAEAVNSLSLSQNGRRALISFLDDTPVVWDFDQGRMVQSLTGHSEVVFALSLHDDDTHAISGDQFGTVYLWDVSQGLPINRLLLDGHPSAIAFAGNRVLIGDVRGQVTFLEIAARKSG